MTHVFIYKELQTTQLRRMNPTLERLNVHILIHVQCTVLDILDICDSNHRLTAQVYKALHFKLKIQSICTVTQFIKFFRGEFMRPLIVYTLPFS